MLNSRSKALTPHNFFQVPLEGTALTLGILGVVAGSVTVFLLDAVGLGFSPLVPIRSRFLLPLDPGGFLFTFWRWTPAVHWAATLLVELLLWSLVGMAIARTVISRVSENEPMGVRTALSFAVSRLGHSLSFFALILGILTILCLPLLLPGLVGQLPAVGEVLGTIAYVISTPFLFLLGLIGVAVLLAGFPVGYLFLPASLAAREGPFLDCVARSVGYAFARPFLFIWDAFRMVVFAYCIYYIGTGILPWLVKGMPTLHGLLPGGIHPAAFSEAAAAVERFVLVVIRLMTGGFVVAYVFGAGTLIYLNLRLEVDGVGFEGPRPDDPDSGAEA